MGGSGGGGFRDVPKGQVRVWIDQTQDATISAEHNASINATLGDLLAQYNDRDVALARNRLEQIEQALEDHLETAIDLRFGGSIDKHTYVDGLSDVDALAILRDTELQSLPAREVLRRFAAVIGRELGYDATVDRGQLAVTIQFPDGMKLQILPAIQSSNGIRIPAGDRNEWSSVIRPEAFASKLTERNQDNAGRLVPVIKLAKAALADLPESIKLSGYHLESLAVEAFRGYTGVKTYKTMLHHLFEEASKLVLSPIRDSTGQSLHVDEDLGGPNSRARQHLSGVMSRIARRMSNADRHSSSQEWLQAMGE